MKHILALIAAAVAIVALASACGSATKSPAAAPNIGSSPGAESSNTSVLPPASPTAPSAPAALTSPAGSPAGSAPAASSPAVSSGGPCTQAQLTATIGNHDEGMGSYVVAMVFTNHSASSCIVSGYPGVAGLNAAGSQIAQATRTTGTTFGGCNCTTPPTITLAPNASVSALVGFTNPGNYDSGQCTTFAALAGTPPNTSTTVHLTYGGGNTCGFKVTPVVSGTNGGDTSIS